MRDNKKEKAEKIKTEKIVKRVGSSRRYIRK